MALLMIQDASAESLASYDQIIAWLEAEGHGHPHGRLSHTAVRKGEGYLVADVWESQGPSTASSSRPSAPSSPGQAPTGAGARRPTPSTTGSRTGDPHRMVS